MDNNKNRMKDRPKSNAELRKMYWEKSNSELRKIDPTGNADVGIENGEKIGAHAHNKKSYKTYEWMQDK